RACGEHAEQLAPCPGVNPGVGDPPGDRPMYVLLPRCAGLDVHKKFVIACALCITEGGEILKETLRFGTTTNELLALSDWLAKRGVTQLAMESTGVYWKPVF